MLLCGSAEWLLAAGTTKSSAGARLLIGDVQCAAGPEPYLCEGTAPERPHAGDNLSLFLAFEIPLLPFAAAVSAVLLVYFICAGMHQRGKD
jgi:hypothetical protein